MEKAIKTGIVVGIAVAFLFAYSGLNIFSASSLKFKEVSIDDEKLFRDKKIDFMTEACNPTFFPASFSYIYVDIFYIDSKLVTYTYNGKTVMPQSSSMIDGTIQLGGGSDSEFIISGLRSDNPDFEIDVKQVRLVESLNVPIFNVIPLTLTKEQSYTDYKNRSTDADRDFC